MKTTLNLKTLLLASLIIPATSIAQPEYVFTNPSHVSGTALQEGAIYKYTNVYANTDAFMTIVDLSNGMTLSNLDANTSGYDNAFQPVINCPSTKKSYVEFRVNFVEHSNNNIPKSMTEVPMTGLDIDGYAFPSNKIHEFNQFKTSGNYYINFNMTNGDLNIGLNSGWYEAMNRSATVYAGIDTTAKSVMFSMVTANVSSISFRIGTDNKSTNNDSRQSSVYFKKFAFANIILPVPLVTYFGGAANTSAVNLNWSLATVEDLKSIVVERSIHANEFVPVHEITIKGNKKVSFSFMDQNPGSDRVHYRLVFNPKEEKSYYSKVLFFQMSQHEGSTWFTAYPAVFKNDMTLRVKADQPATGTFRIVNYAGATVQTEKISLSGGTNTIMVDANKVGPGNYIAIMEAGDKKSTQKIIKL